VLESQLGRPLELNFRTSVLFDVNCRNWPYVRSTTVIRWKFARTSRIVTISAVRAWFAGEYNARTKLVQQLPAKHYTGGTDDVRAQFTGAYATPRGEQRTGAA